MRPGPALLVGAGLFLLVITASIGTPADADLWGHLTFGRDIVTSGHAVQVDRYSFTSDVAWVNHEWLAETVFYEAYRLAGSTGLVVFKLTMIAALFGVIFVACRIRRAGAAGLALLLLAFVGTYWRMHNVRPQLFSVLFFAILLMVMTRADEGRRRGLLILPPLMALWVNLHGGWVVGIGVLGLWTAVRCLDWRAPWRDRVTVALVGLAALGATLANPYGIRMWTFLAETVRPDRADIEEWGSILTYPLLLGVPWTITLAAAALAIWRSGRPKRLDYVVIVAVFAVASFRTSRLDAFFGVAVVILLAPQLLRAWPGAAWQSAAAAAPRVGPPIGGLIAVTTIALAIMIVPAARVIAPFVTCLRISGLWVPEADAARFVVLNHLRGRMVTPFNWGEYAIWHFAPDLQVSMDGRRETVYSDRAIQANRRFYAGDDPADTYLRQLAPDYIWVPKDAPVVRQLQEAGWMAVFQGSVSIVYARAGAGPFQQVVGPAPAMRCFPGP